MTNEMARQMEYWYAKCHAPSWHGTSKRRAKSIGSATGQKGLAKPKWPSIVAQRTSVEMGLNGQLTMQKQ